MLCEECKAVFKQPLTFVQKERQLDRWSAYFPYNVTLSGLEQKATCCYCCRGILRQLVASQKQSRLSLQADTNLLVDYSLSIQTDEKRGSVRLWSGAKLDGRALGKQIIHFDKAATEDESKATSTNTGSTETLEFIRNCLSQCRAHHQLCSSTQSSVWYPTRLIEVAQTSFRLVETAETNILDAYVSLSHCWGNAQILKLITGNIASLKENIPFARLPQTFQDAIQTVRNLGINYIWIDSLCIIQNSDEDWQKEARTMLQVYKHAFFNIAATRSSNSFGGLFTNRNPDVLGSEVLDIDNGVLKGRFDLIDEDYFGQEIDNAPLNRRSWVAQERILSPRIIHFASEQVIWDCSELTACESLPRGTKVWSQWGGTRRKFSCKQSSHFVTRPRTLDEGLGQWARIVNTYSDCGLTVLGDKLIAIFGVAEHLRNELKVEYHAGLWREKMEIQLAWYVTELQVDRSPRNDLAPSWSWTSINGAVDLQQVDTYEGYDITTLASITEVDLRREADQLRGEKVVGHLRMRCSLNPVTVEGGAQNYRLGGKGMEHARSVVVDSPDVIGAERLYFVPLFDLQTPLTLEEWNVMSQIRGLIVQGVEGKPGNFTRCGHAFIADQVDEYTRRFSDTYEAIKSAVGKAELPCDEYNPDLGHLITLI